MWRIYGRFLVLPIACAMIGASTAGKAQAQNAKGDGPVKDSPTKTKDIEIKGPKAGEKLVAGAHFTVKGEVKAGEKGEFPEAVLIRILKSTGKTIQVYSCAIALGKNDPEEFFRKKDDLGTFQKAKIKAPREPGRYEVIVTGIYVRKLADNTQEVVEREAERVKIEIGK